MTQRDLAKLLATRTGLSLAGVLRVLKELPQGLAYALNRGGGRIVIAGLGAFRVGVRKKRRIADPQTGMPIYLPASKTVKFRPSSRIKGAL